MCRAEQRTWETEEGQRRKLRSSRLTRLVEKLCSFKGRTMEQKQFLDVFPSPSFPSPSFPSPSFANPAAPAHAGSPTPSSSSPYATGGGSSSSTMTTGAAPGMFSGPRGRCVMDWPNARLGMSAARPKNEPVRPPGLASVGDLRAPLGAPLSPRRSWPK